MTARVPLLVATVLAALGSGCGEVAEIPPASAPAPTLAAAASAPSPAATAVIGAPTAAASPVVAEALPHGANALLATPDGVRVLTDAGATRLVAGAAAALGAGEALIVDVGTDGAGRTSTRALVLGVGAEDTRSVQVVPGAWGLPVPVAGGAPEGIAWDGSRIVLSSLDAPGRFVALSASGPRAEPRVIDLGPRYAYDAIARDGRSLIVVEDGVRIRAVDLATGALRPGAIVDKSGGSEAMAGEPVARVATDGWVYTVYEGGEETFVHALEANGELSLCLDLPRTEVRAARRAWSIGASPDGRTVVALNARLGVAHAIDVADGAPGEPRAVRVGRHGDGPAPVAASDAGVGFVGPEALAFGRGEVDARASKPLAPAPAAHLVGTPGGVLLLDAAWRPITRIALPEG